MIDGVYEIELKMPFGRKKGKLSIKNSNGTLSGLIDIFGKINPFHGGVLKNDKCHFLGTIATASGKIHYDINGTINNGKIDAIAKTTKGNMKITGVKTI